MFYLTFPLSGSLLFVEDLSSPFAWGGVLLGLKLWDSWPKTNFWKNEGKKPERPNKTEELIHERKHISLLLDLAVIGNESQTLGLAIRKSLHQICRHTSWPVGHGYIVDSDDTDNLISTKLWFLQCDGIFQNFKEVTEQTHFRRGLGLPGRVLECGEAIWIFDVTKESYFPRRKVALDVGVHSAFAFPILAQGKVVAVLEFFSEQLIKKNDSLIDRSNV